MWKNSKPIRSSKLPISCSMQMTRTVNIKIGTKKNIKIGTKVSINKKLKKKSGTKVQTESISN